MKSATHCAIFMDFLSDSFFSLFFQGYLMSDGVKTLKGETRGKRRRRGRFRCPLRAVCARKSLWKTTPARATVPTRCNLAHWAGYRCSFVWWPPSVNLQIGEVPSKTVYKPYKKHIKHLLNIFGTMDSGKHREQRRFAERKERPGLWHEQVPAIGALETLVATRALE